MSSTNMLTTYKSLAIESVSGCVSLPRCTEKPHNAAHDSPISTTLRKTLPPLLQASSAVCVCAEVEIILRGECTEMEIRVERELVCVSPSSTVSTEVVSVEVKSIGQRCREVPGSIPALYLGAFNTCRGERRGGENLYIIFCVCPTGRLTDWLRLCDWW